MPVGGSTNNRGNRLIAPNLDALLEQEDKMRARLASVFEKTTPTLSPRTVSPAEDCLVGRPLAPPPRHPRVNIPISTTRAIKPNLVLDTELQARETPRPAKPAKSESAPTVFVESPLSSSFVSNPFINPAPTLAELQDIRRDRGPSRLQSTELSPESHDGSESSSQIVFSSESPLSAVDVNARTRIFFGPRHRQQNSVDSHRKPWQILHGNSDAKRPSTSPGHAHISTVTREPAYTTENQSTSSISISSTVYSPTGSDKDPYSYNDPVPLTGNSEDNHLLSHSTTSTDCPQISPIRFSRRLSDTDIWPSIYSNLSLTGSSSKADFPPTTLEPTSYSMSMDPEISRPLPRPLPPIPRASKAPLPPTTNFLDPEERADLVRKTRELLVAPSRVFGKTPGGDLIPVQELVSLSMSRYSSDSDRSRSSASRRHSAPPDDLYSMIFRGSPPKDKADHNVLRDTFDGGDAASASVMLEVDKIIKSLPIIPASARSQSESMFDEEEQADERQGKRYHNTEEVDSSLPPEMSFLAIGNRLSNASSSSSGRRRSLPALSSRISLDSEFSTAAAPETNDVTGFQVRRRKAAKLKQFFGVDYRELINDVL